MLQGKAKEEFEKWYYKEDNDLLYNLDEIPDIYQNALIIEWFDSVGIKILPCYGLSGWYCEVKDFNNKEFGNYKCFIVCKDSVNDFDIRTEATTKAIEKAVEIFNQLNK
jgi:hypothetical protein